MAATTSPLFVDPLSEALAFLNPCGSRRSAGRVCKSWRVAAARARVRFVGGSAHGAYSTPQAALAAAQPFDEVRFSAGEHAVLTDLVVSLPLTLVGVRGATLVLHRGATLRIDHPEGRMRGLALRRSSWERPAAFWRARQRETAPNGGGGESINALHAPCWGSRARDEYDERVPLLEISPHHCMPSHPVEVGVGVMASSTCWRIEGCSFDGGVALHRPGCFGDGKYDTQIERHPCIVLGGRARARVLHCSVRNASVGLLVRGESPCTEVIGSTFARCVCGVEIDVGGGSPTPCSAIQRCTFDGPLERGPKRSRASTSPGTAQSDDEEKEATGAVSEESVGLLVYRGCVAAVENHIAGFGVGAAICGGAEERKARDPNAEGRARELFPAIFAPGGAAGDAVGGAAGGVQGGGGGRALGVALRNLYGVEPPMWTTAQTHDVQRSMPFDVGFFRNDVAWCAQAAVVVQVSFLLFTVTFYANLAHSLTRSP
jgi:hypothetical protein